MHSSVNKLRFLTFAKEALDRFRIIYYLNENGYACFGDDAVQSVVISLLSRFSDIS